MEIITWKQLQIHAQPIVILDADGYWRSLRELFKDIVEGGFAHPKALELFSIVDSVDGVFEAITSAPEPDRIVLDSHL
jgi:predicted Rossmann-fold nucleotide-binding protein